MATKTEKAGKEKYYRGEEWEGRFGWCGFEPKWLQFINKPFGFLCVFTIILITQGILVNGIFNVIISTLEKRFGFSSSEMGLVAVSYDIGYFVFSLFITFYANRGHRPRLMAIGSIFLGTGALLFAVPHFTTDIYVYGEPTTSLCSDTPEDCSNDDPENLHAYLGLFIVAMMLQGVGCIPFFTASFAILEDSLPKNKTPLYVGWANAMSLLGPVFGYVLGAWILTIYVDFHVPGVTTDDKSIFDPRWVGAWWLGHLLTAVLCFGVIMMPMFGFPRQFPGSAKIRAERDSEVHAKSGAEVTGDKDFGKSISDMPAAIKALVKNPTYILTVAGGCSEAFIISGFIAFLPKAIENLYNTTPTEVALYAGLVAIPGGVVGNLIAGVFVSKKNLRTPQLLTLVLICLAIVFVVAPVGLYICDDPDIIGITISHNDINKPPPEINITAECNSHCNCDGAYFNPVCQGNFSYFSPCHAGCYDYNFSSEEYLHCLCEEGTSLPRGLCAVYCNAIPIFLTGFFIINVANFALSVPAQLVVLRCVPDNQRSFAMGLQVFLMRAFGSIPGPLIFGVIFDASCLFREELSCGQGLGSCYIYDSWQLALTLMSVGMSFKVLSGILFYLAKRLYKGPEQGNERIGLSWIVGHDNQGCETDGGIVGEMERKNLEQWTAL